jgi:hypothetical protein
MARLKELEQAEDAYLIFNGWNSIRVRGVRVWSHSVLGYHEFPRHQALSAQRSRDEGVEGHEGDWAVELTVSMALKAPSPEKAEARARDIATRQGMCVVESLVRGRA